MDYHNNIPQPPQQPEQPHVPQQSGDVARGFKLGCGLILAVLALIIAFPLVSGFVLAILVALGNAQ